MANKCEACASYCFLISIAGAVILVSLMQTYLAALSFFGSPEFTSKLEEERRGYDTTKTLIISAAIYLALIIVSAFFKYRKNKKVDPMDYDPLPDR